MVMIVLVIVIVVVIMHIIINRTIPINVTIGLATSSITPRCAKRGPSRNRAGGKASLPSLCATPKSWMRVAAPIRCMFLVRLAQ